MSHFRPRQRVKIHPASDVFMMGELYAEVIAVGRKWITVRGERSGRRFKFGVDSDLLEVV